MAEKTTDLKQLAKDIHRNAVFGSWQIQKGDEALLRAIFMPLFFMAEEDAKKMVDDEVIHIYEYYDAAIPRAINGYPMFTSLRMLTKAQWEELIPLVKRLEEMEASL